MNDHKFTDDEIIKALECCVNNDSCKECPINPNHGNYGYCTNLALTHALALINRQKVEIEALKIANEKMYSANKEQEAEIEELREINKCRTEDMPLFYAEAIKEFAERLKKRLERKYTIYGREYVLRHLRELVKEMTEEAEL